MIAENYIWVFCGSGCRFPAATFRDRHLAEVWIKKYKLSGILTKYPINQSVYDWAIMHKKFHPTKEHEFSSEFIQNFSSAYQEHYHFEDGMVD